MSAFFVANTTVHDQEKFKEYSEKVAVTFEKYGGRRLARGFKQSVLVGESGYGAVGIFQFADEEAMMAWYNSDEYQALVPLRDSACTMSIVTYAGPD